MQNELLHSPTLDSVLMVEKIAREYSGMYGKYQLWRKLPKQMMYQTFQAILGYLEESGKLIVENEKVIWIWDPAAIRKLKERGLIIR